MAWNGVVYNRTRCHLTNNNETISRGSGHAGKLPPRFPSARTTRSPVLGPSPLGRRRSDNFEDLKSSISGAQVQEVSQYMKEVKDSWKHTGCSVLLGEWKDQEGRKMMYIMVDSPAGLVYLHSLDVPAHGEVTEGIHLLIDKVIKQVRLHNLVQIVASSASPLMNTVRSRVKECYSSVVWAVSSTYCFELILELLSRTGYIADIVDGTRIVTEFFYVYKSSLQGVDDFVKGEELIRKTKFPQAKPYLCLENIVNNWRSLAAMFSSSWWNSSMLSGTIEGKKVVNVIRDPSFWGGAAKVLKLSLPIVAYMRTVDASQEPLVGFIYPNIKKMMCSIKDAFGEDETAYEHIWNLIKEVWDSCLHSHLYTAGYFLNPCLQTIDFDDEVDSGLKSFIFSMIEDKIDQHKVYAEARKCRNQEGMFCATVTTTSPVQWWQQNGGFCPELQCIAIKVLGQRCIGASSFELNLALAERTLKPIEDPVKRNQLQDLLFVHHNLVLKRKCAAVQNRLT